MEIRRATIPYASRKKKHLEQRETFLTNEIKKIENRDIDNATENC